MMTDSVRSLADQTEPVSAQFIRPLPKAEHNVARMLRRGALVTLNSDDPSCFGGYLLDNYLACAENLGLSRTEIRTLAQNSIKASFMPDKAKQRILDLLV